MNKIFIVNKAARPYKLPPNTQIFSVDRASPVGNPFFLKTERERDIVCDQYSEYFFNIIAEGINQPFLTYLQTLQEALQRSDIALACWCAPKRCHAETIRNWLIESVLL